MLASTMHISTNNQPPPEPRAPAPETWPVYPPSVIYVLPEKPRPSPALVLSGSNRVSSSQTHVCKTAASRTRTVFPAPPKRCPTRDAGRCRQQLASVSAIEPRPPHPDGTGS
jgi:hypothetical protein